MTVRNMRIVGWSDSTTIGLYRTYASQCLCWRQAQASWIDIRSFGLSDKVTRPNILSVAATTFVQLRPHKRGALLTSWLRGPRSFM